MTGEKDVYAEALYFNCPHCNGSILFAVEASEPPEVDIEWRERPHEEIEGLPSHEYFDTMLAMEQAIAAESYDDAVAFVLKNIEQLADSFKDSKEPSLMNFPVLNKGGRVLALEGKVQELKWMHEMVRTTPALKMHTNVVDKHLEDMKMFEDIRQAVMTNPGCLQSDVKNLISVVDGRRVATLIDWLDKHGDIVRTRQGRKIFCYPADSESSLGRP